MHYRVPTIMMALAMAMAAQACGPTDMPTGSSNLSNVSGPGGGNEVRSVITLRAPQNAAFPAANGKASWKSKPARRELEIEVEDLRPGRRIDFFLDGARVGARQTVNGLGEARIELSTQLGQPVPVSVAGKRVEARTATGVLVVSGTF
jgi:hypothetical protein